MAYVRLCVAAVVAFAVAATVAAVVSPSWQLILWFCGVAEVAAVVVALLAFVWL